MELPPVQVSPLADDGVVREGVTQEVDVLPCDPAGEDVSVLLLSAAEELQGVGSELQRTAQVGDQPVLHRRFSRLSGGQGKHSQNSEPLVVLL